MSVPPAVAWRWRGRCQKKNQPSAAASASAAPIHGQNTMLPDGFGAGVCRASGGGICSAGRSASPAAPGSAEGRISTSAGAGAALASTVRDGFGEVAGEDAGGWLRSDPWDGAVAAGWRCLGAASCTGAGDGARVTVPLSVKSLSWGGPTTSLGGGAVVFSACCARAGIPAASRQSEAATMIRKRAFMVPRRLDGLRVSPRGAINAAARPSLQAQLTLTGVDQHQLDVFVRFDRNPLFSGDGNPVPCSRFHAVDPNLSAGNKVHMPGLAGIVIDASAAF